MAVEAAADVPVPAFPAMPRAVADATLDWHEYVTAVAGTKRLLYNQVAGGALYLGWTRLTIQGVLECCPHVSPDLRDSMAVSGPSATAARDGTRRDETRRDETRRDETRRRGQPESVRSVLTSLSLPASEWG